MWGPELVREAIEAVYEVRDYSGRGMYGRQCIAIESDDAPHEAVLAIVDEYVSSMGDYDEDAVLNIGELIRNLKGARVDSMGLGSVIYWPEIPWESE